MWWYRVADHRITTAMTADDKPLKPRDMKRAKQRATAFSPETVQVCSFKSSSADSQNDFESCQLVLFRPKPVLVFPHTRRISSTPLTTRLTCTPRMGSWTRARGRRFARAAALLQTRSEPTATGKRALAGPVHELVAMEIGVTMKKWNCDAPSFFFAYFSIV